MMGPSVGAAASPAVIPVILSGMGYILWKIKRLWIPVTFLFAYGIYLVVITGIGSLVPLLLDGTTIFFAFIMLPEPLTSRGDGFLKYMFGPLVVLLIIFARVFNLDTPDIFLSMLLTANLVGFAARKFSPLLLKKYR